MTSMTPFEKYFQDTESSAYDSASQDVYDTNSGAFTDRVQFQIPHFMYTGPPTLAPGGGAEVLPIGTFNHADQLASSWFTNNHGFSPQSTYLSSSLRSCIPGHYTDVTEGQGAAQSDVHSHHFDLTSSTLITQPTPLQPPPQTTRHGERVYSETSDQLSLSGPNLTAIGETPDLSASSSLGLPVYSATGFDVLSILARVATRPNPRVVLGPVDLTCSFVVVDVRRHDQPIVYCSPSFCRLTGYSEAEVIGRNCRFLQSPDGQLQKGEQRRFTSAEAVAYLKKHLLADKECQTSIVNYRKGGSAFINLVTVIPITGGVSGAIHEDLDVDYHVGFQVDLTEQPNAILQKVREGSYIQQNGHPNANRSPSLPGGSTFGTTGGSKKLQVSQPLISKELKKLLADADFVQSIPITNSTTVPPLAASSADKADTTDSNQWLSLMLLESYPDFVHVVSLKGNFLYVAPSVRRVLGYEPEEMVGGSIADFSHPEDVVPLMRELKESSSTGGAGAGIPSALAQDGQQSTQVSISPRTVDLLFRARTKGGAYVWVECRGRLHVEPGKGRKAIILSGRAREMPSLRWDVVRRASPARSMQEQGFWSMLGGQGTFVVVGSSVRDVLGWDAVDLIGRHIGSLLSCDDTSGLGDEIKRMLWEGDRQDVKRRSKTREKLDFVRLRSRMRRANGGSVDATVVLYRPMQHAVVDASPIPSPIICQIKLENSLRLGNESGIAVSIPPPDSSLSSAVLPTALTIRSSSRLAHQPEANVFEELETSRSSSWQYELQQLKFANQRLEDEVCFLEAQLSQPHVRERVQGSCPVGQGPQDLGSIYGFSQENQLVQPQPLVPVPTSPRLLTESQISAPTHTHHHAETSLPQAAASLEVLTSPLHTTHITNTHNTGLYEICQVPDQRRHSRHCSQSQYTPLHLQQHNHNHMSHHQRQLSYPPYVGYQSYPLLQSQPTGMKRTWDSAQMS